MPLDVSLESADGTPLDRLVKHADGRFERGAG
jgi:hypothetical protein